MYTATVILTAGKQDKYAFVAGINFLLSNYKCGGLYMYRQEKINSL